MRADAAVMARLMRSYSLMLDFYGFELVDATTGAVRVAPHAAGRFSNLVLNPHNYLRISRILKCLGEFDLEGHKINWLRALEREVLETRALARCEHSYVTYWVGTIYDDNVRREFLARASPDART